jgi:hypothetical protein
VQYFTNNNVKQESCGDTMGDKVESRDGVFELVKLQSKNRPSKWLNTGVLTDAVLGDDELERWNAIFKAKEKRHHANLRRDRLKEFQVQAFDIRKEKRKADKRTFSAESNEPRVEQEPGTTTAAADTSDKPSEKPKRKHLRFDDEKDEDSS